METRAHYVLIGAFVMIIVAAGFLTILFLAQTQTEYDEYDIIFTERVSGLSQGAQVRFNGIQKGEVVSLNIDPDNPAIVIARVRVDKDTPVKTDTGAELEPVGFTGLLIIQLVGGSAEAPLLKDVSERRVPQIEADMSSFGALFQGSGDVIARASQLLSDDNIESFAGIISNVETITGAIAENDAELSSLVRNASKATEDLARITERLDAASAGLQKFMEEDAPGTVEEIEALLDESQALVADLRSIANDNRDSIKVFADQGLGQVAPALAEARRLMRTLDYMLREIDRDPEAYFLGENAPEYGAAGEEE
jgi:phospholipid/cholesterol/gamma-HCH transport system substrate-binding protein